MTSSTRRSVLGGLSLGLGVIAAPAIRAAAADGHAAGFDVAAAPNPLALIPRRPGEAPAFTASLDKGPLKATSGGWARDITTRTLPLATGIAGAHLFINAGGAREMHWHDSDEWAYVLGGHGQITAVDAAGAIEVVNIAAGDLWYFPRGHAHAIQTLGEAPLHAVLAFNDGLYGEHGTFGISDWMSRIDPVLLAQALGAEPGALGTIPQGETYIMQGPVLPLDGPQAAAERPWSAGRSHRFRLTGGTPWASAAGGTIHLAGQAEFPVAGMTGLVTRLQPGAMQPLHWHPGASEWHYVAQGRVQMTLFTPDKHMAVAEIGAGDCAYIPANCGHSLRNTGGGACEVVSVLDAPAYQEASLAAWLHGAPRHLLANNLGMAEGAVPAFPPPAVIQPA